MNFSDESDAMYKPLFEIIPNIPERVDVNAEQLGLGYLNILPYFGKMIELGLSAKSGVKGKLFGKLEMLTPQGEIVLTQCCEILIFGAQTGKKLHLGIVKVPRTHVLSLYWKASSDEEPSAENSRSRSHSQP
ncbi:uncharacterized protein LOC117189020 [Drosophila miranda]|uniref:uncharacterized protein LOC117189020 n=1 Tax=Drosophila miranda TaxID=7229 RepID=UPI00143F937D|nr:uncharacterized protein LOC117189020 [Drosophila miranda]